MRKLVLTNAFFLSFFLIFLGYQTSSQALVDLKNANFADTWVDMVVSGTGYDLKIQRGYNSRTLFNGIFGFGWCTDFETSVNVTAEGNLKFTDCGAGPEVTYEAQNFSEKDVEKTIKLILEKAKNENSSGTASYLSDLDKKLHTDVALRSEYAAKYGITRPIADKTKYFANGRETDFIEKQGNYYVRVIPEGGTQKFKLNGKLEKLFDRNGNFLTLNYDGKTLKEVIDNNGRKLTFSYFGNGKVRAISGPGNVKTEYKYKNLNDLIYAKTAQNNAFNYVYDDLHNMIKITYPDKSTKELTYNKNKDWVTSLKDIDGCVESYEYVTSTDDPKNHFWANVVKKCKAKIVVHAKYEFWYEMRSDKNGLFLKKSRTVENEQTVEVVYNDIGRPLTINKNNKYTKYEYFDNGLLKKKITPDGVVTGLKYENTFKKVSRVERAGKASEFTYDGKGNLVKAVNTDGQRITLTYDTHGRIMTIEDQAKRKVLVKYDEKFGKPNYIEREGLGAISIAYNARGEVQRVISGSGGTVVASQVATTFYNLLDLIQPAGVTLTL